MQIEWIEPGALAAAGIPLGPDDLRSLHAQGIRAIVTLTERPLTARLSIPQALLDEMGFVCLHAPVVDQEPPDDEALVWQVARFVDRMRAEHKPVLLHCAAGIGRTGTMLHAYYIAEGMSLDDAKAKVRAAKPTSQFFMLSDAQKAFIENFALSRMG
ncbi:MAG: dual specificity protein phosphatase family protein [Anaerolineae bacterium]|nr:dual specificity protein phosphatase family protein [Anaerolineae bacterium]